MAFALTVPDYISEFRFAVPEPVSGPDPNHHPATPPPIDMLVQREKARRDKVGCFDYPMAKLYAMDLFHVQGHLSVIYVPSLHSLSCLVPDLANLWTLSYLTFCEMTSCLIFVSL